MSKKIIITGGGTGGHVMPLMAVVDELKKSKQKLFYIGSGSEIEKEEAKKRDLKYKSILTGKYRRYFDWQNFIDAVKFFIGIIQSFFIVLFFWPDVVFSKGGYVGLPVIYAAWVLGRPIYIHETDAILGLANRLAMKKCQKIFVSFPPKYYPEIPVSKVVYSGSPLREDYEKLKKEKLFENDRPVILVTGGSQGARFINQTIAKIVPELTKKYNVIHFSGKLDHEWLKKNAWKNYKLFEFSSDFPKYIYNCDLVITRSGGTVFEIAYCKKPAILIPLPGSANNHQEANAKILASESAAIVLHQKNLTPESLLEIIERLMEDKKLCEDLAQKLYGFYREDAEKTIVEEIIK